MDLLQMTAQQRGGPHRGRIAVLARVALNDRRNQRVDDAAHRRGPAFSLPVGQARRHGLSSACPEPRRPVVDALARHALAARHLGHRNALV
jgi:hypothetical protein